jgi:hypothetical protein
MHGSAKTLRADCRATVGMEKLTICHYLKVGDKYFFVMPMTDVSVTDD